MSLLLENAVKVSLIVAAALAARNVVTRVEAEPHL